MIRDQKQTVGVHRGGNPNLPTRTKLEPVATLAEAGIDKKLSSRAQKLAAVPESKSEGRTNKWLVRSTKASHRSNRCNNRDRNRSFRDIVFPNPSIHLLNLRTAVSTHSKNSANNPLQSNNSYRARSGIHALQFIGGLSLNLLAAKSRN
jgi:hypothetical protein